MTRGLVIGAALALLVGGCGGSGDKKTEPGGAGSLRVKHVVDASQGVYVEGSIWHVRVVDSDGSVVLDKKLADDSVSVTLVRASTSWRARSCRATGTAATSTRPRIAVRRSLRSPRARSSLTVTLKPAHGCSIAVLSRRPEPRIGT